MPKSKPIEALVRIDLRDELGNEEYYYPYRCANDNCHWDGHYRFGWGKPDSEAVCSFDCYLIITKRD